MGLPDEDDWSFRDIRVEDTARADRLQRADGPEALREALRCSFIEAWENDSIRLGIDGLKNDFSAPRAIIQFKVGCDVYDWFYNARTGYRAQYWISPENGTDFNDGCVDALRRELLARLSPAVRVAKIARVTKIGCKGYELFNLGHGEVQSEDVKQSLATGNSKLWICEDRIEIADRCLSPIGHFLLADAAGQAQLVVPRWARNDTENKTGEGLRAPYPTEDSAWIDLKGGFVIPGGAATLPKSQVKRAEEISCKGWT